MCYKKQIQLLNIMSIMTTLRDSSKDELRECIVIHSFIERGMCMRKYFALLCTKLSPGGNLKHLQC